MTIYLCDYYSKGGEQVFHAVFEARNPVEAATKCAELARKENGIALDWLVVEDEEFVLVKGKWKRK
jgi:hypothetical protein